ncbi:ABC-type glycerol-3-phosphate transport system substrate-binding protein [Ewingella americana]
MSKKLRISLIATAVLMSSSAISALPEGYPADYQKLVDGAKKEGKVVIYSTTDVKAAGPLIQGFEATYPGVKVEYNDMNSTELYNRFISEQAAGRQQRRRGVELLHGHRAEAGDRLRAGIFLAGAWATA